MRKGWNSYYDWLIHNRLLMPNNYSRSYSKLFSFLLQVAFVWDSKRFPFDENRAMDGLYLRKYTEVDSMEFSSISCSVLEMLVALAIRIEEEYIGDPNNPEPYHIFLEMLDNLGLLEFKNDCFDEEEVHDILEDWMYRRCEFVIFPLRRLKVDQQKRDIWGQMQAYLTENY